MEKETRQREAGSTLAQALGFKEEARHRGSRMEPAHGVAGGGHQWQRITGRKARRGRRGERTQYSSPGAGQRAGRGRRARATVANHTQPGEGAIQSLLQPRTATAPQAPVRRLVEGQSRSPVPRHNVLEHHFPLGVGNEFVRGLESVRDKESWIARLSPPESARGGTGPTAKVTTWGSTGRAGGGRGGEGQGKRGGRGRGADVPTLLEPLSQLPRTRGLILAPFSSRHLEDARCSVHRRLGGPEPLVHQLATLDPHRVGPNQQLQRNLPHQLLCLSKRPSLPLPVDPGTVQQSVQSHRYEA